MLPSLSLSVIYEGHSSHRNYSPLSSKVQALRALVPERHTHTGDAMQDGESFDGLSRFARVPECQLTIAHARKSCSGDAVMFAHYLIRTSCNLFLSIAGC
ncbi:hypothetical protein MPTK1_8g18290 [Marchantia polymorpha subsp. ruderalis]|uniref:Uncharacterized protein n=1 Tax=Marchantia polymorpha TaxID=3197 RepID=A0A2R6X8M2_MARPO|nr:hypothetical protein MARPO_0030s0161 [Marchantia polymorpha]BBN20331.1 hypothetical protein Mp_8g18290 [Marchantia polymorpha subsp. ruderalis]|eukprot:PTQ42451.1 hypothetical protein MARPO_0030s0161 [Marchantia polymorpha]